MKRENGYRRQVGFCFLFVCLWASTPLFGQDEKAEENEEQKETRAVSIRDLQEADDKLDTEKSALNKTQERINMLIEDLTNRSEAIATKESSIQELLKNNLEDDDQEQLTIPAAMVAYWDKRDPVVAANDFIPLYKNEPLVAVELVKQMKKKTSAKLLDEVSKLGDNGIKVAAKVNEAVGTGRIAKD